jgi:hypothetical protein
MRRKCAVVLQGTKGAAAKVDGVVAATVASHQDSPVKEARREHAWRGCTAWGEDAVGDMSKRQ